ncbi:DUF4255 domain-containing protein [Brevibacillus sp. SYSU BS000544]|uniref:DUF4255 domain-containing protein n=1 Tax=Brevibacillus sp. SYSU BS000544 TaxID=3416443 RepID=UPI003CE4F3B6
MSGDVIASVGETLVKLLEHHMEGMSGHIALLSPSDPVGQDTRLTLCLFNVAENPYMKNQELNHAGSNVLQYPPLVLDLYYLMTPHSHLDDKKQRTLEEHRILGGAMRVFYDHPNMSGSVLQGTLAGSDELLKITLNPMSLGDLTGIWQAIPNQHFKPSVSYVVSPVRMESMRRSEPKRVVERTLKYAQIEVKP